MRADMVVTAVDPTGQQVTLRPADLIEAAGVRIGAGAESEADDPMTPAEFRMVRLGLGLTQDEFGEMLGLWSSSSTDTQRANAKRRVRRYEAGTSFVPDKVRVRIEELERLFHALVTELAAQLNGSADVVLTVPHADGVFPADFWLAVARETAIMVPGLTIRYPQ